jgi:hypothetical protein
MAHHLLALFLAGIIVTMLTTLPNTLPGASFRACM